MNAKEFERLFKEQNERSEKVLCGKAKEYAADDDRLHNFKVAAALQGKTPRQALAGMMAKHTISVYDMCWGEEEYTLALWAEKITDSINYHHLLNALVREEWCERLSKLSDGRDGIEDIGAEGEQGDTGVVVDNYPSIQFADGYGIADDGETDKVIAKHKQKTCEHEWVVVCAESNEAVAVLKCKKCGKKTLRQNEVMR